MQTIDAGPPSPGAASAPAERRRSAGCLLWLAAGLGWLAGIAWQLQQATLLDPSLRQGLGLGALLLAALAWLGRPAHTTPDTAAESRPAFLRAALPSARLRGLLLACAAAALALASTDERAARRLAQELPATLEGQDLIVSGHIVSLPQRSPTGTRFLFEVDTARRVGQAVSLPPLIRLAWYAEPDADALLLAPGQALRAGQRWQLRVRLRAPHGALNPQGFDTELWLFEQGIRAVGYVRALPAATGATRDADNRLLAEGAAAPIERLRQAVRDAIERQVADPALAGVLAALAIGDQAAIEREDWDLFRATGVAHLMSISGLHVTMLAWLAGGLMRLAWRRSARLTLWLPAPTAGHWAGLATAFGYALLAGWGVPAQRTVWMIALVLLLRLSGRRWPPLAVLLAAAVLVSLLDPWALLQAGFWLSFVAVALLMGSEPAFAPAAGASVGWRAHVRAALRTQLVATVGLAPLTLVFFQQLSLVGFAANLLAIPWVTLLVTPLALLGVLLPMLWSLAALCVQALVQVLGWLAQLPWATWSTAAAPGWAVVLGLFGGWLAVAPLPVRWRLLALPLVLPLLWPPLPRPPAGRFELLGVDIGQGTAVLVRTREHLLVYDSGPRWSADTDAGSRLLLPLLRARGERRIDRLVLSHRDSDHVGGAAALLRFGGVQSLWHALEPGHPLLQAPLPQQTCAAGQHWEWDGVRFSVLHPLPGAVQAMVKPNHLSCTLRIEELRPGGRSALLTGDIEAGQEAALVEREGAGQGAGLRTELLLVPHHGSRTSSTAAFLDAVQPRLALFQAAYRSRFGHPAPDVVQRYLDRGIEVVRSDRCGAFTWRAPRAETESAGPRGSEAGLRGTQECLRTTAARYWHHRPSLGLPELAAGLPELPAAATGAFPAEPGCEPSPPPAGHPPDMPPQPRSPACRSTSR